MSKKIIIIDGNSLLFRAYFATSYPGVEIMRSEDGTPTNAIFAFSNMINRIVSSLNKDDSLVVAFDKGKANFRKDLLKTYKANRKPTPEDLLIQLPIAREFLRKMNIFQYEVDNFEGDDICGTIAKKAYEEGYDVEIYTSDKDFLQLSNDKITINIMKKGLSDVIKMTPNKIKEEYGFDAKQIIDYKGLRGDDSDNLPGIPLIGEKTAVKLINEYGSFDNIIAHKDEIKGRIGESIRNNIELGKLSRDLAIIKDDVPLPFRLEDLIYEGYDFSQISEFAQKYSLKQLIKNLSSKYKKAKEEQQKVNIKIVESFKNISLSNEIGIALDYMNKNDYQNSDIYGISICTNNSSYYIDFDNFKKDTTLLNILKDPSIKKCCYDFKAIKVNLNRYGIDINGLIFDLLIANYLLDSSFIFDIEYILNLYGISLQKENLDIPLLSSSLPIYTSEIAYYTLFLRGKVEKELIKSFAYDLYLKLELPLVDVLANMEIEGFPLSKKVLDEFGNEYKEKLHNLEEEIWKLAGIKFNISSPKQLGEILFDKLGLKTNKKKSTSYEILKDLINDHPIINLLLEYRKYFKLVTSYIDGLKEHIRDDNKIHANFNQALTSTGRLSSSNPNLQNISVRTEEGKNIRKAFFYPTNDYEILSLDYSQIELRILAHLSNDPLLISTFNNNEDIHEITAREIFNIKGEVNQNERRKAKTVNFGIVYGISDFGLADELGISIKEAKNIINNFYNTYQEVNNYFNNVIREASKNGYVSTMFSRRRYINELQASDFRLREFAKRAAINAPIQGSAADIIKLAMIKVHNALITKHLETKMVLQIHDELIFKVPLHEKEIVFPLIKNIMENIVTLKVPLLVSGGFGKSWYEAK